MGITHLDYEETLRELQAFLGQRVMVSVSDAATEFVASSMVGPLHSAVGVNLAEAIPDLEGDLAGETLYFVVADRTQTQPGPVYGGFGIWRDGFAWGRRVDGQHGITISLQVGGLQVRVRAAPPGA